MRNTLKKNTNGLARNAAKNARLHFISHFNINATTSDSMILELMKRFKPLLKDLRLNPEKSLRTVFVIIDRKNIANALNSISISKVFTLKIINYELFAGTYKRTPITPRLT